MRSVWASGAVGLATLLGDPSEARACTCIPGWSLIDTDATEIPNGSFAAAVDDSGRARSLE